jgi:hypothetical protein
MIQLMVAIRGDMTRDVGAWADDAGMFRGDSNKALATGPPTKSKQIAETVSDSARERVIIFIFNDAYPAPQMWIKAPHRRGDSV